MVVCIVVNVSFYSSLLRVFLKLPVSVLNVAKIIYEINQLEQVIRAFCFTNHFASSTSSVSTQHRGVQNTHPVEAKI